MLAELTHARFCVSARTSIAAIFFLNGFVFASWVPHIPGVMERHALTAGGLGALLFAMGTGAICALPFAGVLVRRFSSATMTSICAVTFCAMLPLPVLLANTWLVALALFVFGALNAILDVAMNAQGAELEQRMARPIMSSFHGWYSTGGLTGAGAAAALLDSGLSYQTHVAGVALLSALAAAFASRGLLRSSSPHADPHPGLTLPSRAILALGALTFAALLIEGAMADWSAVFLQRERGFDVGGAALGYAAFSFAMAAARFGGDSLSRRLGAVTLVRLSSSIALIGLALALYVQLPWLCVAGFALVGIGMANLVPVLFSAAARVFPSHPGAGLAAVATTGYLGFLAGPPGIGVIADWLGLPLALGVLLVLCIGIAAGSRIVVLPADRSGEM